MSCVPLISEFMAGRRGGDIKVHQLHQDSRPKKEELHNICPVGQGIVVSSCFSNMPTPISVFMAEFSSLQPNLVTCTSFESVPLSSSLPLNEGDCPPVLGSVHWFREQGTNLSSENYSIQVSAANSLGALDEVKPGLTTNLNSLDLGLLPTFQRKQ